MDAFFFILLIVALGLITVKVAEDRGAEGSPIFWFIGGALLFIIALPFALKAKIDPKKLEKKKIAGRDMKKCPRCAEMVQQNALICPYCQQKFSGATNV
jgi:hypothetical protein